MSICELWVARCAAAAIDSGFDLDLLSFGEERTFCSRDYDASMVRSVSLTFDVDFHCRRALRGRERAPQLVQPQPAEG